MVKKVGFIGVGNARSLSDKALLNGPLKVFTNPIGPGFITNSNAKRVNLINPQSDLSPISGLELYSNAGRVNSSMMSPSI